MNILERLKQEILAGDGAAGTMLHARGVTLDSNFEHPNLLRPTLVRELAGEYVSAGAQVIETNTCRGRCRQPGRKPPCPSPYG